MAFFEKKLEKHFGRLKKRIKKDKDEFSEKGYCYSSAKYVVNLFAGNKAKPIKQQIGININRFFREYKYKTIYKYDIFQNFFQQEKNPKHSIFYISLSNSPFKKHDNPNGHFMVIEKISDGKLTFWRTYHSYLWQFNLHHWVGNDDWPQSPKPWFTSSENIKLFNSFGNGKLLTVNQIQDFIEDEIYDFSKLELHYYLNIKEFRMANSYSLLSEKMQQNLPKDDKVSDKNPSVPPNSMFLN